MITFFRKIMEEGTELGAQLIGVSHFTYSRHQFIINVDVLYCR